jgi:predicted transcriptional regulator
LNLGVSASLDYQQQQPRRRTNRVHNQRKNTGRIIWNDETKEVEIRDDTNDLVPKTSYQQTSIEESHRSDDQKLQDNAQQSTSNSGLLGSRALKSRFEHNPTSTTQETTTTTTNLSPTSPPPTSSTSRNNRSQSQDPSRKSLTTPTSLSTSSSSISNPNNLMNGMASSTPFAVKKDSKENSSLPQGISSTNNDASAIKRLYDDAKRKVDELTQKIDRLERDIVERDQIIEKLKTSQYIESSLDKREKRAYERKISELEEELKKMDSIKADNTRLKEENAALIRVISKLSK